MMADGRENVTQVYTRPVLRVDNLIVFDLDDTLYLERDYLHSAWREIAQRIEKKYRIPAAESLRVMMEASSGFEAFELLRHFLEAMEGPDVEESQAWMVEVYRNHRPDIKLEREVVETLDLLTEMGYAMTLLTEGRYEVQRSKVDALGLLNRDNFPISILNPGAKENGSAFQTIGGLIQAQRYMHVGDNPAKDFHHPNLMGWETVALVDTLGRNVHPQRFDDYGSEWQPRHKIESLAELPQLVIDVWGKHDTVRN